MTKYLLFLLLFAGAMALGEPLYSVDAAIAKGESRGRDCPRAQDSPI